MRLIQHARDFADGHVSALTRTNSKKCVPNYVSAAVNCEAEIAKTKTDAETDMIVFASSRRVD